VEVKMGARTQVFIKDTGVYLYSHWGSGNILKTVKKALARKQRWSDPEYLARIVFETMIGNNSGSAVGFGVGTTMHSDIDNLVTIDCKRQVVSYSVNGKPAAGSEFIDFNDFVADLVMERELEKENLG